MQVRFQESDLALGELFDNLFLDIEADDFVAELCKAGRVHKADVAAADNRDFAALRRGS